MLLLNGKKEEMKMTKTFEPTRSIFVDATCPPHKAGTQYKVSKGIEGGNQIKKIQLVVGGKIAGKTVPSYPEGTDDLERVLEAMKKLDEPEPLKCPLCDSEMGYKPIAVATGNLMDIEAANEINRRGDDHNKVTHMWSCEECPGVLFEFYNGFNSDAVHRYLSTH